MTTRKQNLSTRSVTGARRAIDLLVSARVSRECLRVLAHIVSMTKPIIAAVPKEKVSLLCFNTMSATVDLRSSGRRRE